MLIECDFVMFKNNNLRLYTIIFVLLFYLSIKKKKQMFIKKKDKNLSCVERFKIYL